MERKFGNWSIQRKLILGLWILILMLEMFVLSSVIQGAGTAGPIRHQKRAIQDEEDCLTQHRGIKLHYKLGTRVRFEFDLCSVIHCEKDPSGIPKTPSHCSGVTMPKPCSISPSGFYFVLGVGTVGEGPFGLIKISLHNATISDYNKLTPGHIIGRFTGDMRRNLWVSWMAQTDRQYTVDNCVACAAARPILTTEPAPSFPFEDPRGYTCILELTKGRSAGCKYYHDLFPPINNNTKPGPFTPGNKTKQYVCFNFTGKVTEDSSRVGVIPPEWCIWVIPGDGIGSWVRAGLYYYCGGQQLFVRIPSGSIGVCALLRLVAPLLLMGPGMKQGNLLHRIWCSSEFDLTRNSPTYIDAVGVPRGVAAGFESTFLWITTNKNVDRINCIHYNMLRLSNLTRDAVEGLADQLAPTALMAVQNRMALDMLLAEKGGVCAMFGDMCCTLIPNNTAPDGLVTKALEGLRTLSETMHEQSDIDNPLDKWLTQALSKTNNLIIYMMISLSVFLAIMVTCGCCFVPCIRSLAVRFIVLAESAPSFPLIRAAPGGKLTFLS
uniref:Uncharacterized protein n=1 Tax=Fundulus heteroclitus TaxID=8078 RepID=A0A3Q2PY62_FUNHE